MTSSYTQAYTRQWYRSSGSYLFWSSPSVRRPSGVWPLPGSSLCSLLCWTCPRSSHYQSLCRAQWAETQTQHVWEGDKDLVIVRTILMTLLS